MMIMLPPEEGDTSVVDKIEEEYSKSVGRFCLEKNNSLAHQLALKRTRGEDNSTVF